MVRAAYTLRADDDDWGQAGTLVRKVVDEAARAAGIDRCGPFAQRSQREGAAARNRVVAEHRRGGRNNIEQAVRDGLS
jgi:catalase